MNVYDYYIITKYMNIGFKGRTFANLSHTKKNKIRMWENSDYIFVYKKKYYCQNITKKTQIELLSY